MTKPLLLAGFLAMLLAASFAASGVFWWQVFTAPAQQEPLQDENAAQEEETLTAQPAANQESLSPEESCALMEDELERDVCYMVIPGTKTERADLCEKVSDELMRCLCLLNQGYELNSLNYEDCKQYVPAEVTEATFSDYTDRYLQCRYAEKKTEEMCKTESIPTQEQTANNRDLRRQADIRQISTAMELAYFDYDNAYPASPIMPKEQLSSLISNFPEDPGSGPCQDYQWISNTANPQEYCAYACLENGEYMTASSSGAVLLDTQPSSLETCKAPQ